MKNLAIDDNAHTILKWAKEGCNKSGIESPSFSDAIRWMRVELLMFHNIMDLAQISTDELEKLGIEKIGKYVCHIDELKKWIAKNRKNRKVKEAIIKNEKEKKDE